MAYNSTQGGAPTPLAPRNISASSNLQELCARINSLNAHLRGIIGERFEPKSELATAAPPHDNTLQGLIEYLRRELDESHAHVEFISARL